MTNLDVHFSSKSNEWETPQHIFDDLNKEFDFTLDPCATKETAKCSKFYTKKEDGLTQKWDNEVVFCNPPYGREIKLWVKKAKESKGSIVVMLIPARTDTAYFHDYIYNKAEIRFLRGRIKFEQVGKVSASAPFPSMLVIFKNE